jgi:hypothetical protein
MPHAFSFTFVPPWQAEEVTKAMKSFMIFDHWCIFGFFAGSGRTDLMGHCMTPEERKNNAKNMFNQYPDIFPLKNHSLILNGIVAVGMTPFEARLAGGAFTYKVIADKCRWPEQADPLKVMWGQSTQADASEIWMTFNNNTQFNQKESHPFVVYFKDGCAKKIEEVKGDQ